MKQPSPRRPQGPTFDANEQDHEFQQELRERREGRPSRLRRSPLTRMLFWLLVPATIVWMAPTIIGWTSLHQSFVQRAVGPFDGQLDLGSVSLGWLSPVRLRDVTVQDAQGNDVIVIPQVESERTLFGLLTHSQSPGLFRVIEPVVTVRMRENGSNLEDILASLPKQEEKPSSSSRPALAIEIVDGTVVLADEASGESWRVERLLARADVPSTAAAPLLVKLETRVRSGNSGPEGGAALAARGRTRSAGAGDQADEQLDAALRDASGGSVSAELTWNATADAEGSSGGLGKGQLQFASEDLPLESLAPLLRRFVDPRMNLGGSLTMRGGYQWSAAADEASSASHQVMLESLDLRQLDVLAPQWLKSDRVRVPQLAGRGQIALQGARLDLRDVDVNAGFARVQADGSTNLDELRGELAAQARESTADDQGVYELRGELDLARLSQLLPDTLRVREGTEIKSGKLSLSLTSRPERTGRRWEGKLESSNLVAENLGRRVTWEQPVQIQLAALMDGKGLVVERLDCVSSFLQAEARGTLDDGQVALQGDLEKLAQELAQFVDLGSSELGGKLHGDLAWRRQAGDVIDAQGQLRLEQFHVAVGQARPWHEEQFVAKLTARATAEGAKILRLDTAELTVTAGKDSLQASLSEAVESPNASTVWPVQGRLLGNLEHWLPRVQVWLPLDGWALAGVADATFVGRVAPQAVQCDEGKVSLTNFQARGPGWNIVEPQMKVELAGEWNRAQGRIASPGMTFTSSAIAMRAENVSIKHGEQGLNMGAIVGFRSDLGRLSSWMHEPGQPATWSVGGMAVGQVKLTQVGAATSAEWSCDVEKLTYAVPSQAHTAGPANPNTFGAGRIVPTAATGPSLQPVWFEPKIKLTGQGQFDGERGELDVARLDVSADDLQVIAKGKVSELGGQCIVDLEGELGYDLEALSARFREQLGGALQIQGRDSQPFVLRGPLLNPRLASAAVEPDQQFATASKSTPHAHWPPADLTGEAGLRWDSIVAYGLPIGAGEVQGKLNQGAIDFKPLDVKVSEGQLRLAPRLLFEERGPVFVAQAGPALDDVRISPQMCSQWLKFVLPILADATQVDGRMSVGLDDTAVVPLAEPLTGEIRGTIDIKGAQVGPGPLSRELISLAQLIEAAVKKQPLPTETSNQQRTWVELPGQQVGFHWKNYRVYHQGLQMAVKDVVIMTRGSVGVDHSIDLLAEIPVRDEWVASNRYLQSLKGQRLQVPISGTLTAPRVDRRALQQIAAQSIGGAARGALEQEVTRGIDKLLRPRGETPPPGTTPSTPPAGQPPATNTPPAGNSGFPFIPKLPFPSQP